MLSKVTEEKKEDVWKKVAEERQHEFMELNGLIKMDNESICIVGHGLDSFVTLHVSDYDIIFENRKIAFIWFSGL